MKTVLEIRENEYRIILYPANVEEQRILDLLAQQKTAAIVSQYDGHESYHKVKKLVLEIIPTSEPS